MIMKKEINKTDALTALGEKLTNSELPCYALLYSFHEVWLTEVKSQEEFKNLLQEKEAYLREGRLFNEKMEIYFWKTAHSWKYRFIADGEKDENTWDEEMILQNLKEVSVPEDRETGFKVKLSGQALDYKKIKVRNYLQYDEQLGQVKVVDARLVALS